MIYENFRKNVVSIILSIFVEKSKRWEMFGNFGHVRDEEKWNLGEFLSNKNFAKCWKDRNCGEFWAVWNFRKSQNYGNFEKSGKLLKFEMEQIEM